MKNIYIFTLALATVFAFGSCSKDDAKDIADTSNENEKVEKTPPPVVQEQKAVGFYFTGITCNPCGSAGIPNFQNIKDSYAEKFVPIEVHLNIPGADPMKNAYGDTLATVLAAENNSISIPKYFIANKRIAGSALNAVSLSKTEIDKALSGTANINGLLEAKMEGENLKVTGRIKYFTETETTYKIALYILEDDIKNRQVVNGQYVEDFTHDNVLRGALTASLGNAITSDTKITKDTEYTLDYSKVVDGKWNKANLKVAAVIWKWVKNSNGQNIVSLENGFVVEVK